MGRYAGQAGGKTCPREGLVFPGPGGVAAAPDLVAVEGRDRGHEQARVAVGPQRGVDVEQLARTRAQREPGDEFAHEGAINFLQPLLVVLVLFEAVVVQEDHVQVAAIAQFLAAQLAIGDDRQPRLFAVTLFEARPGPAQRQVEHRVGQRAELIGHLLDAQAALDVAHQGAKNLGMVRVAQGVEQLFLVVLTAALPGHGTLFEFGREYRGVEPLVQQALVGQFVDHARVAHEVLHGPTRHAQQAQQTAMHLGPLDQQRQVVFASQQWFDPVHKPQRCGFGAAAFLYGLARALHQATQAQATLVAQRLHARLLSPAAHARRQRRG